MKGKVLTPSLLLNLCRSPVKLLSEKEVTLCERDR